MTALFYWEVLNRAHVESATRESRSHEQQIDKAGRTERSDASRKNTKKLRNASRGEGEPLSDPEDTKKPRKEETARSRVTTSGATLEGNSVPRT